MPSGVAAGHPVDRPASPDPEEERLLESHLQVNIPTREEMAEIEDSSRFYEDGNVLYMTTSVVGGITEHRPSTEEVTFVLSEKWLITVRYADLRSFREFENRCIRQLDANRSSTQLFALMMDSLVDRIADVLEAVQGQLSSMSRRSSPSPPPRPASRRPTCSRSSSTSGAAARCCPSSTTACSASIG